MNTQQYLHKYEFNRRRNNYYKPPTKLQNNLSRYRFLKAHPFKHKLWRDRYSKAKNNLSYLRMKNFNNKQKV